LILHLRGLCALKGRPIDAERKAVLIVGNKALAIIASLAILVAAWSWFGGDEKSPEIKSIAVLPLENMMNDPAQQYFVDGMHEALITALSRLHDLRIISRTSVLVYRGNPKPMHVIADELNVDAVIEGSVLLSDGKVRITTQLIGTRPERHIWAEEYIRNVQDVLGIHNEVAKSIAESVHLTLTKQEQEVFADWQTVNPEAYEHYLKANYQITLATPAATELAAEHYLAAIALEPSFAPAYEGMASLYYRRAQFSGNSGDYELARDVALNAIELDPNLAGAHAILSTIYAQRDWDWEKALKEHDEALRLAPYDPKLIEILSYVDYARGAYQEAVERSEKAMGKHPVNDDHIAALAHVYFHNHQYNEAVSLLEEAFDRNTDNWLFHFYLAMDYSELDQHEKAVARIVDIRIRDFGIDFRTDFPLIFAYGTYVFNRAGEIGMAATLEAELVAADRMSFFDRSVVALGKGDKKLGLDYLEKAADAKEWGMMVIFPWMLDDLANEPRFQAILKRMGRG